MRITKKHLNRLILRCLVIFVFITSGAGGSRTLVQTGNQYGFYMLILLLVVGKRLVTGNRSDPYFPENSRGTRNLSFGYPGLNGTPYTVPNPDQGTAGYPAPDQPRAGDYAFIRLTN